MNIISAIFLILLGVALLAKERVRGNLSRALGFGVSVISLLFLFDSDIFFSIPVHIEQPSFFDSLSNFLLGTVFLLPNKSIFRKYYYLEFTAGLSVLLSSLYLTGYFIPITGISNYTIFGRNEIVFVVINIFLTSLVFASFRLKYESKPAFYNKLFTLIIMFVGLLFSLSYASYLSNLLNNSTPDLIPLIQYIPIVIIILGVLLSVLFILMMYAFNSLRERTFSYANEVTKGLREAKAKDEALLLSIGEGLVATGKDGNIIFVNRAFESMLGWKEEEVQGKLFLNLVHMFDENGKETSKENRPFYGALQTKNSKDFKPKTTTNMYYRHRDGTIFPVAITISPIVVEGEMMGVVEVFRDITREKEIDKEKTEFVSLASHQLRTPLSSVNWYTEMLLAGDAGKLTKKQKEYADEIFQGTQRMVSLVNDLLNVSRLELGTFSVNPEKVDVVASAFDAIDEQKQPIKLKKLKVTTDFPDERPLEMDADPKLLHMIFQNLLSNAIKYTGEKGNINLAVYKKGKEISIEVSDDGIGIPKDQQERIFQKLFRADNVKEKDVEGTGLGLYVIKSVVEKSGGNIRFESKEGEGAKFIVTFPEGNMTKREGSRELS